MKKIILVLVLGIFLFSLVSAKIAYVGINRDSFSSETDPYWTANYTAFNDTWSLNNSDYWDALDDPSDISYDDLSGGDVNALGYTGFFNYIQGVVGQLNIDGDPWYLSGTDLEIDQDLQVNNTIVEHDIMPLNTLTGNIGSGALRWLSLWVQNISTENIDTYNIVASGNITASNFFGNFNGTWNGSSSYVPYTGADKNVNLGNNNISISNFSSYQVDGINFIKYYATYQTIAIGKNAGKPLYESLFIGDSAGKDSSGYAQVEVGTQAGQGSTGEYQTALGYQAGYQNTGDYPLFMGFASGYQNKGYIVTASGVYSAMGNEGDYVTSHGYVSGYYNKGDYVTSIGYASARENLGNNVIAVGYNTAMRSKGNDTIAIGYEAGKYNNISNQFILKQSNINAIPLIQGNFLNGFVGIGTTTPTTKLDVNGTTNSTGGFSVGTNVGLTANYSIASGECFLTITGGLVTNTNCTSL